jgi:hypothetical protein
MSIIKDHEVFEAYFANEERDTITVELVSPDDHETPESTLNVFLYTIPADKKNPDYIALLEKVSEDELYERTVNKFRAERKAFEEAVVKIAEQNNELTTISAETSAKNIINVVQKFLNKDFDEQELFTFKLGLFENEAVQQSTNRKKKADLRKAKTLKETFKKFLDF